MEGVGAGVVLLPNVSLMSLAAIRKEDGLYVQICAALWLGSS